VLLRPPGVDARVAGGGRFALGRTLGLHLELGLAFASGPSFTAYDGWLLPGAGLQLTEGLFRLEVGVSLGALLHTFDFGVVGAAERQGARLDFLGRPFVRATVNPVGGLLLWVQVGAGLSSRAREHRLLGEVLYVRGALWLDVAAGLGWET
jgi:hypothetical protein